MILVSGRLSLENLAGMGLDVDFADGIHNDTLLVDDVGGADGAHGLAAVHLLHAPGLIGFEDGAVGVGNEVEGQIVFGDEALVRFGRVFADTQHLIAEGEEALVVVAQVAGFGSAARCAVLGIEIQHQLLAGEIGETDGIAVFVKALKSGGRSTYCEHNMGLANGRNFY